MSPDWAYDVGLYACCYRGTYPSGFTRPRTTEVYAPLIWKGIALEYSCGFTNLFGFPDSKHSDYVDLSHNYEFTPGWTVNSHVGHQGVPHTPGYAYHDCRVGVTRAFAGGCAIALGYYDTNARRSAYTNPTAISSVAPMASPEQSVLNNIGHLCSYEKEVATHAGSGKLREAFKPAAAGYHGGTTVWRCA